MFYFFQLGPDDKTQMDHLSRCYPDFRLLEPGELPQGVAHGCIFSTVKCIHTGVLKLNSIESSASMYPDIFPIL